MSSKLSWDGFPVNSLELKSVSGVLVVYLQIGDQEIKVGALDRNSKIYWDVEDTEEINGQNKRIRAQPTEQQKKTRTDYM